MTTLQQLIASVLCPRYPLGLDGIDFGDGGDRPLPGGCCVFRVDLPDSLFRIAELRAARGSSLAPYLCSDLERGAGQQIDGLTRLPAAIALGAARAPELARAAGALTAREARDAGVACVFAPVLDVGDEPRNPIIASRSLGADPDLVARLGAAWIEGCLAGGAAPVAKHFPGHGATLTDSHLELPVMRRDRSDYERVDERPFRVAIERGLPAIMAAHVHAPPLCGPDPRPASLSARAIQGRLRDELGFDGTVFTDALDMGAIDDQSGAAGPAADPAVRALAAGSDVPLLTADPHRSARAIRTAVEKGILPLARLQQAAKRIRRLVEKVEIRARPQLEPDPAGRPLALEIARRSIVRIAGGDSRIAPPLADRDVHLAVIDDAAGGAAAAERLLENLRRTGLRPRLADGRRRDEGTPLLVAVFGDVRAEKGRVQLEGELLGQALRLLAQPGATLLSVGPPQAVIELEGSSDTLFVFADDDASLATLSQVLAGAREAPGRPCWSVGQCPATSKEDP